MPARALSLSVPPAPGCAHPGGGVELRERGRMLRVDNQAFRFGPVRHRGTGGRSQRGGGGGLPPPGGGTASAGGNATRGGEDGGGRAAAALQARVAAAPRAEAAARPRRPTRFISSTRMERSLVSRAPSSGLGRNGQGAHTKWFGGSHAGRRDEVMATLGPKPQEKAR